MPRARSSFAAILAIGLAVAPGLAFARVGGGSSFGSRGGMTYSAPPSTSVAPYSAAPMQRSYTPQSSPNPGVGNPGYGAPAYAGRGGLFGGGGFTSGLMGGLLGAGIGGMLFGHGMFGGMDGGGGSFIGLVIQLALLFFVGRWLLRMFMSRQPAMAGGMGAMQQAVGGTGPRPAGGGSAPPPITLSNADYTEFDRLLNEMQAAWSAQDLARLSAIATPEMASYFSEQLTDLTTRGLRNTVRDVRLLKGDLAQAWAEGSREYATVAMQFSMLDVTQDAQGRVVDGSATERQTATELWTFLRSRGGRWILSAIQQAR